MGENKPFFSGTSPCGSCPYRKDSKLATWDKTEFEKLLEFDKDYIGKTYKCHKNDGSCCKGWLMNQDKRSLPSIALRIMLSKEEVSFEYLDSLNCESEMFETIEEMAEANFPDILTKSNNKN
tara:strand:+ start:21739 stop:22104 length:366 start_codon:yes stop_codon:yes gene_type:complete